MKPILMNINEISDSREVYESKPNPFFSIFIYSILGMLSISLVWMYFGKIDVVVKSEGMIRPNNQVATVVNTYGGRLEEVLVEDNSFIIEGDILYIIEHNDLLTELEYYNNQIVDTEHTLSMLNKYKKSVEDGVNCFKDIPEEEEYYIKTESYIVNYKLTENDINYNSKECELNLSSVVEQLEKQEKKLMYTQKLKSSITSNKNLLSASGDEQEYYNKYLKFQNDYISIEQRYINTKLEINSSITEEGLINSLEYYNTVLNGLKTLKSSIEKGENLFDIDNSYSLQYEEYINQLANLTAAYEQTQENYEVNKALEGLAVSEWEVQQSKGALEEAKRAIDNYKVGFMNSIITNITEIEKNIKEIALSKENTLSKDKLLEQNEKDRVAALDDYRLQYVMELDNNIQTLEENIASLEVNKESLELQKEKVVVLDEVSGTTASLSEYRNREISTTIGTINTYENKKRELVSHIDKIKAQIDSAIVKATMTGSVNSNIELVEGDILQSGVEVLSIIPENDKEFKVNIYVSNKDIGKLSNDMKVKLNVYALPNSEYGYLTGTITSISNDLKVDNSSGSAYYLVEAKLDRSQLFNSKGQEGNLKAGMACQAQMITENKRILLYMLEKIDLWMDK